MSCEFLKDTAEILVEKLSSDLAQIEILDVLPADEFGQDDDEVVIQWLDPVYKGGLNEMRYYIRLTMDELTITLDTCVDEMELKSIIDPEWDKLDKLTQEIFLTLIKK